jgi:hypothetical protein
MNNTIRLFTILFFLSAGIALINISTKNNRLDAEVKQLQAELGRMSIDDVNRVHLVEIKTVDIPPEVASQVIRVWQFRCYLPAGYDFVFFSGDGRVTDKGIYQHGGSSSSWGSPQPKATHKLLTISLQRQQDQLNVYYSFQGSSGATSFHDVDQDRFDEFVIKKLVSSSQGPRSFSQDTILPLLKIYDPSTAEDRAAKDKKLTTFAGCLILMCPKSREAVMNQLRDGETPSGFEPSWLATEAGDE